MIAITGAGGFIGRNLVEKLSKENELIKVDFLDGFLNPIEFLRLLKEDKIDINIILHNGACSDTTNTDVIYMHKVNTDYTIELLKLCVEKNIKLIYASSASVYGDGPFEESTNLKPKNLYASTKSIVDLYADAYIRDGAKIIGLRYFNVYGKFEENKGNMASVVYKFFNQKDAGEIKLFKNSDKFLRDFIYIDDVVNINLFFLNNEFNGIYNVGTSIERSFYDIAKIFVERYNINIKYIDMPKNLTGKYQKFTKSNNKKIYNISNFAYHTLEEGVNKYLDFLELE